MTQYEPSREVWQVRALRPRDASALDPIASRALDVLKRWVRYGSSQYRDWNGRPRCGHFFGGCYWYMGETISTALALSVASSFGDWDEESIGIDRATVREQVIRALRYACLTHDTGPADCVRERGPLHYVSERKWGGEGENYFMATQNGRTVSMLAHTALLCWSALDDETRMLVQNVTASYADRWSAEEPGTGTYYDTQCEENAWTSAGISAAMLLFPAHPHQGAWRRGFRRWARNVITTPSDRARHPHGLIDAAGEDSIQTVTFHPDFTAENHGFVHPAYMCAGINLRALSLTLAGMSGDRPEPDAVRNNEKLYSRAVRYWTQCDGVVVPVQGQDWWYNRQHDALVTHAVMSVVHRDPIAAAFEIDAMSAIEQIQASNSRGCFLEENGEACVINAAHGQFANQLEHGTAAEMSIAFLIHAFCGVDRVPAQAPAERRELEESLKGVRWYPFGGIIVHRTPQSFSSFSYRNHVMAYAAPRTGMWTVTPHYLSFLGQIGVRNTSDRAAPRQSSSDTNDSEGESAGDEAGAKRAPEYHEETIADADEVRVNQREDSFAVTANVPRAGGALRQRVVFASLPDGRALYAERITAVSEVEISELATGLIGIRNEHYRRLGTLAPGRKHVSYPGGELTFEGFYGREPDRLTDLPPQEWLCVDDAMMYLIHGSGGIQYLNRHVYPKWRGVEDLLALNVRKDVRLAPDQSLGVFAVATVPQGKSSTGAALRRKTRLLDAGPHAIAVELDDTLVLARFSDNQGIDSSAPDGGRDGADAAAVRDTDVRGIRRRINLYPGRLEVGTHEWMWHPPQVRPGAELYPRVGSLELLSGPEDHPDIELILAAGTIVVQNRREAPVTLSLVVENGVGNGTEERVTIRPKGFFVRETASPRL